MDGWVRESGKEVAGGPEKQNKALIACKGFRFICSKDHFGIREEKDLKWFKARGLIRRILWSSGRWDDPKGPWYGGNGKEVSKQLL
jgi:hypothetical protein